MHEPDVLETQAYRKGLRTLVCGLFPLGCRAPLSLSAGIARPQSILYLLGDCLEQHLHKRIEDLDTSLYSCVLPGNAFT